MKALITKGFVVAGLLFASVAAAQVQDVGELDWKIGPTQQDIGSQASVAVPDGYVFLGPAGAREFNRLSQNPSPDADEYILAKDDLSWVAFFTFEPTGYIKDDETLDADDLLQSATEGTEASNALRRENGWPPIHVNGWAFKPQYDDTLKSLEWAFRLRSDNSSEDTINYNTRLLGRRGVMEVLLVTENSAMQSSVADFKSTLPGFAFSPGERYADFKPGDHVAEYGLAALVTGGAAAVAAKKGWFAAIGLFLAKMWRLLAIGVIALWAGVRKFFGGKGKQQGTASGDGT